MNLDPNQITEQVNTFWATYGQVVIIATGLAALALVAVGVVMVARSRQRDRWVSGLTAVVVLAWTSEGLWEVARYTLGLPLAFSLMTFFVFEAMMLSSGLQAEQHRARHGTPGPAGRLVWALAMLTGTVVALNAATVVEALLRFTLPLAATGLWWVGITAERDSDTEQVKARRAQETARRAATWAITPRTILVALGVMRPGQETVTDAERERRVRRMVVTADRLHTAGEGGWRARRQAARLRRLSRLATAQDLAEVRARVERTSRIVHLVLPPAGNPPEQVRAAVPEPEQGSARVPVPEATSGTPDRAPAREAGRPSGVGAGHMSGSTTAVAGTPEPEPATPDRATGGGQRESSGTPGPRPAGRPAGSGPGIGQPSGSNSDRASGTPAGSGSEPWPRDRAWQEYQAAVRAGEPLSPAELARRAGRDPKTAWRWIRDWQTGGLVATPDHPAAGNGHAPTQQTQH